MDVKILVSWVGLADLRSCSEGLHNGPIDSVVNHLDFDKIYLLFDSKEEQVADFRQHLSNTYSPEVFISKANLRNPTHFSDIYHALDNLLSEISQKEPKSEVTLQITSGTPSMTAVSILLGKAKYKTRFIQSSKEEGVIEPEIPFEIAADFLATKHSTKKGDVLSLFAGETPDISAFDDIVAKSSSMLDLKAKAAIIAKRDVPVLVYGETGTGKELFARAIHNASRRKDKPILTLNCGAIPHDLIDTTLFGHVKGAFTGATTDHNGYFHNANGGTLFLDEFGELPLESQVRLLRVLQQGTYSPVGSTKELKTDVRIVAATNKDLLKEVFEGRFREDLFYRVAIGIIHLPPLRGRGTDIITIADALLERINLEVSETGYKDKKLSVSAKNFIKSQAWPGNVRELQATLLRASLWQPGSELTDADLKNATLALPVDESSVLGRDVDNGIDLKEIIGDVVKHYTERVLAKTNGNKTRAAELLGFNSYQTLSNWINKYDKK